MNINFFPENSQIEHFLQSVGLIQTFKIQWFDWLDLIWFRGNLTNENFFRKILNTYKDYCREQILLLCFLVLAFASPPAIVLTVFKDIFFWPSSVFDVDGEFGLLGRLVDISELHKNIKKTQSVGHSRGWKGLIRIR